MSETTNTIFPHPNGVKRVSRGTVRGNPTIQYRAMYIVRAPSHMSCFRLSGSRAVAELTRSPLGSVISYNILRSNDLDAANWGR
jgi:hypothetical protein